MSHTLLKHRLNHDSLLKAAGLHTHFALFKKCFVCQTPGQKILEMHKTPPPKVSTGHPRDKALELEYVLTFKKDDGQYRAP